MWNEKCCDSDFCLGTVLPKVQLTLTRFPVSGVVAVLVVKKATLTSSVAYVSATLQVSVACVSATLTCSVADVSATLNFSTVYVSATLIWSKVEVAHNIKKKNGCSHFLIHFFLVFFSIFIFFFNFLIFF